MGIDISNNNDVDGTTVTAIQGRLGATINVMGVANQRLQALQANWIPPGPNSDIAGQFKQLIALADSVNNVCNALLPSVSGTT